MSAPAITLYRHAGSWILDMSQAERADDIRTIMGTDQIPSPFTSWAPAETVLSAIGARNPGHAIMLLDTPDHVSDRTRVQPHTCVKGLAVRS